MGHEIADILETLAVFGGIFGGIATVIWASAKAKLEHRKLDMMSGMPLETRPAASEDKVLAEMKAMRQQMDQMQSTSHQFDLSFDEALNRLEGRISRVETKVAVTPVIAASSEDIRQRLGQG